NGMRLRRLDRRLRHRWRRIHLPDPGDPRVRFDLDEDRVLRPVRPRADLRQRHIHHPYIGDLHNSCPPSWVETGENRKDAEDTEIAMKDTKEGVLWFLSTSLSPFASFALSAPLRFSPVSVLRSRMGARKLGRRRDAPGAASPAGFSASGRVRRVARWRA